MKGGMEREWKENGRDDAVGGMEALVEVMEMVGRVKGSGGEMEGKWPYHGTRAPVLLGSACGTRVLKADKFKST